MEKTKIIVVEDESIVAEDIRQSLLKMGYEVPAVVATGKEAVRKTEELKPDLVLMDIILREKMNGIEAADAIHSIIDVPIIYLTAYSDEKTIGKAKLTEPFGYIIKPFDDREVKSTIEMALYKSGIERKLKENREWLFTVLKSIGDAVIAADDKGAVIFMNSVSEMLTGWSEEEAKGKNLSEIFRILSAESGKPIENPLELLLGGGAAGGLAGDAALISRDGTEIRIDDSSAPIVNRKGEITGVVLVFRDVTERRQIENERNKLLLELRMKNRELEEILYASSHDLRSPLVNVEGYTGEITNSVKSLFSLLQDEQISPSAKEKMASVAESISDSEKFVKAGVSKMASLLSGLMYVSLAGSELHETREIDMNALIAKINDEFKPWLKEEDARIEISQLPPCRGDIRQINQVFSNLIENSVKFLDPGRKGIIKVSGRIEEGQSVYCVEDNGIGIPIKYQEDIFKMFHQLDPKNTAGDGIGLAIASLAVERHNGRIWLESEPGKGSRFFVALPRA
ncbi:MAG: response regulator [Nitrospirae bacterium]|nr:response regulator [Nitrospirota bacterium]